MIVVHRIATSSRKPCLWKGGMRNIGLALSGSKATGNTRFAVYFLGIPQNSRGPCTHGAATPETALTAATYEGGHHHGR